MKKTFLIVTLLFAISFSFAQNNMDWQYALRFGGDAEDYNGKGTIIKDYYDEHTGGVVLLPTTVDPNANTTPTGNAVITDVIEIGLIGEDDTSETDQ